MMDGVTLVSVAHAPGTDRPTARAAIRAALCTSVSQAMAGAAVQVDAVPGTAPQLRVDGEVSTIGIAISHTEAHSFAVWQADAKIGLDVMEVADIADWREVARDYLGQHAVARLDRIPAATRAQAFAREWTAREASLKCLGRGLSEWTELPVSILLSELALPPGLAGTIARLGVPQ